MKYSLERLNKKEISIIIIEYLIIDLIVTYLFYDSYIAFLLFIPLGYFYFKVKRKDILEKKKLTMKNQFIQTISYISTSLSAGFSIENSIKEAKKDIEKMYEKDCVMAMELHKMIYQISIGKRVEEVMKDFSERVNIEEIKDFATIFAVAKKSGGRLSAIIERCVTLMTMNRDTESEIQVMISGKKYEQKVMSYIPFLIIGTLKFSSPDFIGTLYHNPLGIILMTCCLGVYILALYMGRKISDIKC